MSFFINPQNGYLGINSTTSSLTYGVGVYGNLSVSSTLVVTGNAYTASNLIVSNNIINKSNLFIISSVCSKSNIVISKLMSSGNLSISNIYSSGNLNALSNVVVTGNVNVSNSFISTSNIYCSTNVYASTGILISSALLLPVGSIIMWASSVLPNGWLLCDGTSYSSTYYSALYSVIGSVFGSYLPNLNNRYPLGNSSISNSQYAISQTGGSSQVTLQYTNLPSHTHSVQIQTQDHDHTFDSGHTHTFGFTPQSQNQIIKGQQNVTTFITQLLDALPVSASPQGYTAINGDGPGGIYGTSQSTSPDTTTATNAGVNFIAQNGSESGLTNTSFSVQNPYIAIYFIIKF
jgi:microcystin-dependent protein